MQQKWAPPLNKLKNYLQTDKESVKQLEEFEVTLSFTNPLDVALTECEMELEGPGTHKAMKVPVK